MNALYSGQNVFAVTDRRCQDIGAIPAVFGEQPPIVEGQTDLMHRFAFDLERTKPFGNHSYTVKESSG